VSTYNTSTAKLPSVSVGHTVTLY